MAVHTRASPVPAVHDGCCNDGWPEPCHSPTGLSRCELQWPSVKNSNPKKIDTRTDHEAMPVIAGVKQAANAWLHLYAFRKYNLLGCTG